MFKISSTSCKTLNCSSLTDLIKIVDSYKQADSWYETTYVNIDDYNNLQDIMIYGKSIDKKIDPKILITNEFN